MTESAAPGAYHRPMEVHELAVVPSLTRHGAPIPFGKLADRVLEPETRYLVLDLDRTVHLGTNLGELLGWELSAWQAFGDAALDRLESRRRGRRWVVDATQPLESASYLGRSARRWAYPGLYYLLWGKLAARVEWLGRRSFRRHGAQPYRVVQSLPQRTLLRHLEEAAEQTLRALAGRVWARHRGRQVIERADLDRIRARCPSVEILLSSASPRATVEVAAEQLGADLAVWSTLERINSGEEKVRRLVELRPDILEPGVVTVGISDTGYGEDHCWVDHFRKVVDVNSTTPFPPWARRSSPVREVHSAAVLTREEKDRRAAGDPGWLDPARRAVRCGPPRVLGRRELEEALRQFQAELERLALAVDPRDLAFALERLMGRGRAALEESPVPA